MYEQYHWHLTKKFTISRLQLVRSPSWGLQNSDGRSSDGIIGQLATKHVDFAINVLSYTQDRIAIVDYTVVVGTSRYD